MKAYTPPPLLWGLAAAWVALLLVLALAVRWFGLEAVLDFFAPRVG